MQDVGVKGGLGRGETGLLPQRLASSWAECVPCSVSQSARLGLRQEFNPEARNPSDSVGILQAMAEGQTETALNALAPGPPSVQCFGPGFGLLLRRHQLGGSSVYC